MAQQAETTVTKCSLVSCLWAHFLIGSHTMPGLSIVSPLRLCWVKCVCMFSCNLPPALLAEWLGSFTCHCSKTEVERTLNKSQHTHSLTNYYTDTKGTALTLHQQRGWQPSTDFTYKGHGVIHDNYHLASKCYKADTNPSMTHPEINTTADLLDEISLTIKVFFHLWNA